MKKIFIIILSVACLVSCLVIPVSAENSDIVIADNVMTDSVFMESIDYSDIYINLNILDDTFEVIPYNVSDIIADEMSNGYVDLRPGSPLYEFIESIIPGNSDINYSITLSFHSLEGRDFGHYDSRRLPFYVDKSYGYVSYPFGFTSLFLEEYNSDLLPFTKADNDVVSWWNVFDEEVLTQNFKYDVFPNLSVYFPAENIFGAPARYDVEYGVEYGVGDYVGKLANTYCFLLNRPYTNDELAPSVLYLGVPTGVSYDDIYNVIYNEGYDTGYWEGYSDGYFNGIEADSFSSLIYSVITAPINAVATMLNFNILGVNITDFIFGVFTILLVLAVFRRLF